ncbi:MAG: DUF2845 domain-containing protein [Pseudomonadota bacterium]
MTTHKCWLIFTVTTLVFTASTQAANFRCQGRFVDGFTKLDLLSTCGEPSYKDSYSKITRIGDGRDRVYGVCEQIDQWYYINPDSKASYVLEIERGFVKRILRGRSRSIGY